MKEEQTLHALEQEGNLRTLPEARHDGIWIWQDGLLGAGFRCRLARRVLAERAGARPVAFGFLLATADGQLHGAPRAGGFACRTVRARKCLDVQQRLSCEHRHLAGGGGCAYADTRRQTGARQPDRRHPSLGGAIHPLPASGLPAVAKPGGETSRRLRAHHHRDRKRVQHGRRCGSVGSVGGTETDVSQRDALRRRGASARRWLRSAHTWCAAA